jgi:hypothetical protein
MMMIIYIFSLLLSISSFAQVDYDVSGNLEGQARHSWNNDLANDLFQDWKQEDFYLIYGNLNTKIDFKTSRFEANIFGRYSQSDLYKDRNYPILPPYFAPQIFNFPNKLVARDILKLKYETQGDNSRSEYILNKLYYEWDYDQHRFMMGRIYINYGLGEIFNPINPFNQPTGLTGISQIAQGNDGLNFTFYKSQRHTIDFYFLGDKSIDGYEGQIDRTAWAHGEYLYTQRLQLDYVIGEDQRRNKLGGQIKYDFSEAMVFLQALYQSEYNDKTDSEQLWDAMFGYDQQVTNKWHIRMEGGYQKKNRFADLTNINNRFLPTEYFIALSNQYDIHPLVKLGGTFINDIKSGFTYFITRNTLDLGHSSELDLFANIPLAKGTHIENAAQKLVTTDVGLALRKFF